VCAHHLLQHFNDLAKQWFRSLYRIYAPTWLSQNRRDILSERLGKLFFQFYRKRPRYEPSSRFALLRQ